MAGTPVKRERIERERANGELTSPAPEPVEEKPVRYNKDGSVDKRKGASPERMRELVEIRRQYKLNGHPEKQGGRPRTKRTRAEAEEEALQKMVPKALKVLEEQLDDEDERIRQSAAVKVLEWGKGKPQQAIKIDSDATHTIRYETVVSLPDMVIELPDAEEVLDEIEEGVWQPRIGPGDGDDAA